MGRGTTRLKSDSGSMLMPVFVNICEFVCIRISRVTRSGRGVETEVKGEGGDGIHDGIGIRLY